MQIISNQYLVAVHIVFLVTCICVHESNQCIMTSCCRVLALAVLMLY